MALMDATINNGDAAVAVPVGADAGDRETPSPPRTTIASRYEIDLDSAQPTGALALLCPGRDLRTRRSVTVKSLRPEFQDDPEKRARFRREARLLAFLAHPHVIRVFDFVEDHGASWVILEHVRGQHLSDLIREHGPFMPDAAARIIDQAAAALTHLHGRGLVHLDIHPDTLILTDDDRVKLVDFGLAQPVGELASAVDPDQPNRLAYRGPEQIEGGQIGVATDIYALGCLAFELLTGQPPAAATASGDAAGSPIPPKRQSTLPAPLDEAIRRALATTSTDRFPSVEAFSRVFRAAAGGERVVDIATAPVNAATNEQSAAGLPLQPKRILPKHERATGVGHWLGRGTDRLSDLCWRAVAALGLANLLLAAALFLSEGAVPGIYEPSTTLAPGADARVTIADWRVRDGPGLDATALWALSVGDDLTVTGEPIAADGRQWWPVSLERGDDQARGYVAAEGIAAERQTPLDRLRSAIGRD